MNLYNKYIKYIRIPITINDKTMYAPICCCESDAIYTIYYIIKLYIICKNITL